MRPIEVDPKAGPLMRWAFETVATGQHRVTSVAWLRQHAVEVSTSHLHRLLRNPFTAAACAGRTKSLPATTRR